MKNGDGICLDCGNDLNVHGCDDTCRHRIAVRLIPEPLPQRQDSTTAQLITVLDLGQRAGCYDAHDLIVKAIYGEVIDVVADAVSEIMDIVAEEVSRETFFDSLPWQTDWPDRVGYWWFRVDRHRAPDPPNYGAADVGYIDEYMLGIDRLDLESLCISRVDRARWEELRIQCCPVVLP